MFKNILSFIISIALLIAINALSANYPIISTKQINVGNTNIISDQITVNNANINNIYSNYLTSLNLNGNIQINPNGNGSVIFQSGLQVLRTDEYLDETYLRTVVGLSNTNLYIWRAGNINSNFITVFGGKDLTNGYGNVITLGLDQLGNLSYNVFNGNNNVFSNDATFNFNGNFSIATWVQRSNWNNFVGNQTIISRALTSHGWQQYGQSSASNIIFYSENIDIRQDISPLFDWNLLVTTRNTGVITQYINGLLSLYEINPLPIISEGKLEIGSVNGGNNKFIGKISEIIIHNGTVWTPEQIIKIYARESRHFATVKPDGNLDINLNPMQFNLNVTGSNNLIINRSVGILYTYNGINRLRFNINVNVDSGTREGYSVTIHGFKFRTEPNGQAVSVTCNVVGATTASVGSGNSIVTAYHSLGTTTNYQFSGDVELE